MTAGQRFLVSTCKQLRQRLGLGVEALRAALGFGERPAGDVERLAGAGMRGLGAQRGSLRLRDRGLVGFGRAGERRQIAALRHLGTELRELGRRPPRSRRPGGRAGRRARARCFSNALRRAVRSASVPVSSSQVFSEAASTASASATRWSTPARRSSLAAVSCCSVSSSAASRVKRGLRVGGQAPLALDVVPELDQPAIELGHAVAGALSPRARASSRAIDQPLQARRRLSPRPRATPAARPPPAPGASTPRPARRCARRPAARPAFLACSASASSALAATQRRWNSVASALRTCCGDGAIADRLPGLLLERLHLGRELADHVLEPQQVLLGRAQPQLRLVPPRVQARNAGRLFQHAPALLGLGLDDLADAALMHQRRRARAGRGVGEQDMHVAGAHLAAVDAIGRALLALDAARDVERLVLVELGRRLACAVVDLDRDLGIVAAGPVVGAGEDHVVHVGGAQGLVRGLAHHPAQRLDQVRLAAAVRPDHAGEPRLDHEIGRLDEGLEAEQAQARELHTGTVPIMAGWP